MDNVLKEIIVNQRLIALEIENRLLKDRVQELEKFVEQIKELPAKKKFLGSKR